MNRHLFTLILLSACCLGAVATDISKLYKTHMSGDGMIYFVMPQKMERANGSVALRDMTFDVTCLVSSDSVTVTSTIVTSQPMKDSLLTVETNGRSLTIPYTYLYRENGKKGWTNRTVFTMLRSDLFQMYEAQTPFLIDYGSGNRFGLKPKKWKNNRQQMLLILNMIELNR